MIYTSFEETFNVAVKIDLTFKTLVNVKARWSKCERYGHYDYQCPSKSQHVRTVSSDNVDDSKVVENVHVPSITASIIENISVDSDTLIIDEVHICSDSTNDNVDEIVEPNTPIVPNKSFESPCAEYNFMFIPIDSSVSKSRVSCQDPADSF